MEEEGRNMVCVEITKSLTLGLRHRVVKHPTHSNNHWKVQYSQGVQL